MGIHSEKLIANTLFSVVSSDLCAHPALDVDLASLQLDRHNTFQCEYRDQHRRRSWNRNVKVSGERMLLQSDATLNIAES
jgi:hypothetical protein